MEEKVITQEELDRIIKKNSAKYLKKLEEKEAEINCLKQALESTSWKSYGDDEVISIVEAILSIPQKERSAQDEEQLLSLKEAYGHAKFLKDLDEARLWAKDNYDGDIAELLNDEGFEEFAHNINGSISDLLKKYIKLTSKPSDEKQAEIKTPGSVKDTSGVVAKEYFSKEEVEKMTPAQLKKYMPVIEKSMSKW